jgi:hypothetical protein
LIITASPEILDAREQTLRRPLIIEKRELCLARRYVFLVLGH